MRTFIVFLSLFLLLSNPAAAETKNGDWYVEHNKLNDGIGVNIPISVAVLGLDQMEKEDFYGLYAANKDEQVFFGAACGFEPRLSVLEIVGVICGLAIHNLSDDTMKFNADDFALLDNNNSRFQNQNEKYGDILTLPLNNTTLPAGQYIGSTIAFQISTSSAFPLRVEFLPFLSDWTEPLVVVIEDPLEQVQ
jgi:hypothetical protein